jgi:hypothetical protein
MTIWKAILIGQLVINVPAVAIMIAVMFLGSIVAPWPLALLAGSLLAWIWWSLIVPRWRDWVLGQGVDPNRLQKFAVRTGLTWPKGSIFERTEFRRKK